MWFIGVEVEQETSAPPPKKNLGSAPESRFSFHRIIILILIRTTLTTVGHNALFDLPEIKSI